MAKSPSPFSPLKPSCAECRTKMQLVRVAPHPDHGAGFDHHVFVCRNCGKTQTYTLRHKPKPDDVPPVDPL